MYQFIIGAICGYVAHNPEQVYQQFLKLVQILSIKNSVQILENNHYCVDYDYMNQHYQILLPCKKGPKKILKVTSGELDVSEKILPLLGPHENFHGLTVTPHVLGFDKLEFHHLYGDVFKYEEHDEILF